MPFNNTYNTTKIVSYHSMQSKEHNFFCWALEKNSKLNSRSRLRQYWLQVSVSTTYLQQQIMEQSREETRSD